MLDHMGPATYGQGEVVGAPNHMRRHLLHRWQRAAKTVQGTLEHFMKLGSSRLPQALGPLRNVQPIMSILKRTSVIPKLRNKVISAMSPAYGMSIEYYLNCRNYFL